MSGKTTEHGLSVLDRGWRADCFSMVSGAYYICVDTAWCINDQANQWRWRAVRISDSTQAAASNYFASFSKAKDAAEAWLAANPPRDLSVYSFAGLESAPVEPTYRYGKGAPCVDEIERDQRNGAIQ